MEPYLGEIRMFAGNFAPRDWAKCDGQLLNISDYEALYALIGTAYGGDGLNNFALPDLRGRIPIHISGAYQLGEKSGTETVTLIPDQLPSHTHIPQVDSALGTTDEPTGHYWAANDFETFASSAQNGGVTMNSQALSGTGGDQPHENMMPSLGVTFIIALEGIYPNQN